MLWHSVSFVSIVVPGEGVHDHGHHHQPRLNLPLGRSDRALAITPKLPECLKLLGSPTVQVMPGALIEHATYKNSKNTLTGQTIAIECLSALQTDLLLLVQLRDGTQHSAILRPCSPSTPFHLILQYQRGEKRSDAKRVSAGIATPISSSRNAAGDRLSPRPKGASQARQCGVTALGNRVSYSLRPVPCLDALGGL